jgi:xanthine dehydrogenase accessory factor
MTRRRCARTSRFARPTWAKSKRLKEVLGDIERWRGRGDRVVLATVVATRRSAPRPVGAKLAVSSSGEIAGSVSGGCVEHEVYEEAKDVLANGGAKLLTYGITDEQAWNVGLPCGGEIDVLLTPLHDEVVAQLKNVYDAGTRALVVTPVAGDGASTVVHEGEQGDADELIRAGRNAVLEQGGRDVFVEVVGPPPRLLVIGALDLSDALCAAAKPLGWRTVVADARARFATKERIPHADELVVAWPDEVLAHVRPDHDTAVVVLTHDDRFDIPALAGALRTDAFYVAALGSRRNQERRRELLRDAGVAEEDLERIAGPAGLDIGAESPAETAVSILAEALASRAGRAGGRLTDSRHRIHAGG